MTIVPAMAVVMTTDRADRAGGGSELLPTTGVTVTGALALMALLLGAGALLQRRRAMTS